jgi:hypothetical protein
MPAANLRKSTQIKSKPWSFSVFSFIRDHSRQFAASVFFLCILFLSGCATTSQEESKDKTPTDPMEIMLSQAASQLSAPDAPKSLALKDEAQVEWRPDKSLRIKVHEIFATRVKPEHPLPLLATLNQDSQNLNIDSLKLYKMDETGNFKAVDPQPQAQWIPPQENLPKSLSAITSVKLPDMEAGEALEVRYTLETKVSSLLVDKDIHDNPTKPHPVAPEASFAFRWNDYTASKGRELTMTIPPNLELFGSRQRIPSQMVVDDPKVERGKEKTIHMSLGAIDPVPSESFQPNIQDLAPLTAFTLNKSWDEAVMPYRRRVKVFFDGDKTKVQELIGEAGGTTSMALADRVAEVKKAIEQKVSWVDTGLPIYLNPDRPVSEIIDSGKATSHDMAVLLALALRSVKFNAQIYLYRQAGSGELLGDLPALSQMDGILVAVLSGKDTLWIDPTETLAAPGVLPLSALDRKALAVLTPLNWKATPPFGAKDHRRHRDVKMTISPKGDLDCSVDVQAFGASELALRQFFRATTDAIRRDIVIKGLNKRFPGALLTQYRFTDYQDLSKPLEVHFQFQVPKYAKFGRDGSMTFYPVVFEDVEEFFASLRDNRQTPVLVPQNFNAETEAILELPPHYKVQDLPKNVAITNSAAEFSANSKVQFATLSYERYMGVKDRSIDLGKQYKDLMAVYQTVLTTDRTPFKAIRTK